MLTLEDEQFLNGVGIIRKRALLTTAAVAIVSSALIVFFAGFGLGSLHSVATTELTAAELGDRVRQLTAIGRASIVLFLTTLLVAIAGAVVLVLAYERQASHLAHLVRRIARQASESKSP